MKQILTTLLIIIALGVCTHNVGPISDYLATLVVFGVVLSALLVGQFTARARFILLLAGFFPALVIARLTSVVPRLALLGAVLGLVAVYCRKRGVPFQGYLVAFMTTVVFTVLYGLYLYLPEGWYAAEAVSRYFSQCCSLIYGKKLNLGATSYGLFIGAAFLITHSVIYWLNSERSLTRFAAAVLFVLCGMVAFVGINLALAGVVKKITFAVGRSDLHTQGLLFGFLSLSFFVHRAGLQRDFGPGRMGIVLALPLVILCAAGFYYVSKPMTPVGSAELKTVAFYRQGSLDWKTPAFGTYGKRSGGMFGLMPKYLRAVGFTSRMVDSLTPVALANADVLVMINLNKALTKKELFTVWNFVKHGGGLLLLGDHTDLGGLMKNFNRILRMVPISFKFDSAMPARYTWDYLMEVRPHELTTGYKRELTRSWWVGASLNCSYPAEPLVIGKYCYSDWGYRNNVKQAYLGNRRFDYYEYQNDVVLAAWAPYGKGKVMACGDTSAFHNTTFMSTYPFVVNTFSFLADRNSVQNAATLKWAKMVLVLSFVVFVLVMFLCRPGLLMPYLLVCTIGLISWNTERAGGTRPDETAIPHESIRVAYIDYSHTDRFDLMSWEDDSIGGLRNNLLRSGFYPFLLRRFETENLQKAQVLIIIAPSRSFQEEEVRAVHDFINKGGLVVLSVGWEEKEASMPLLKSFGMDVDNVPLAWCQYDYREDSPVQFREAWPVLYEKDADVTVVCRPLGYPAIVAQRLGKGAFVVVGDSKFLLNENLEGDEKHYLPNILFLRDVLLRRILKK
ncbi:MAG: hypothetical protein GY868_01065 [Deltaproteobacteria bacterium]|nr:hypothetical protein [Deltaproteobacteria bacterium]